MKHNLNEILEDVMNIKTLVEQRICSGDTHDPVCQALTKLYWKISGLESELREIIETTPVMQCCDQHFPNGYVAMAKEVLGEAEA